MLTRRLASVDPMQKIFSLVKLTERPVMKVRARLKQRLASLVVSFDRKIEIKQNMQDFNVIHDAGTA